MILEAIESYYNSPKGKSREPGCYWASELWSIHKGYLTVPEFIRQMDKEYYKPIDKQGQAMVFRGSAMEDMLCKVLTEQKVDFKTQTRIEVDVGDCKISGKLDFDFSEFILETKCPDKPTNGVPDKWAMQCEVYFRATGKKVYLGIFDKQGDSIIHFFPYEPNDSLWETIQTDVTDFNNRLLKKIKVGNTNNVNNKKDV